MLDRAKTPFFERFGYSQKIFPDPETIFPPWKENSVRTAARSPYHLNTSMVALTAKNAHKLRTLARVVAVQRHYRIITNVVCAIV